MKTHKSFRLHIGIFGRRNAGKSSLLNALTSQNTSIVSDVAGTTTDPVEKPMELLPLGPVQFIDTAGIDDQGELGNMRSEKSRQTVKRTDLALLVIGDSQWTAFEDKLLKEFKELHTPVMIVFNKTDLKKPKEITYKKIPKIPYVFVSALKKEGLATLKQKMISNAPADYLERSAIASDLVGPGESAFLVVPIDKEAPKGRLILPQVQTIRDLLDGDSYCVIVKERELRQAFDRTKVAPKLVITDSQAFLKVSGDTPDQVPLTSFSILFARFQGDLTEMVRGAMAIDRLKSGDKILVSEACSHHPVGEDIGTVKIPRWLTQYTGSKLEFKHSRGHDFPDDLRDYKLVIHCGACMWNRREMLSRIYQCRQQDVPITNYGLTIAFSLGIFERALEPFPEAHELYRSKTH